MPPDEPPPPFSLRAALRDRLGPYRLRRSLAYGAYAAAALPVYWVQGRAGHAVHLGLCVAFPVHRIEVVLIRRPHDGELRARHEEMREEFTWFGWTLPFVAASIGGVPLLAALAPAPLNDLRLGPDGRLLNGPVELEWLAVFGTPLLLEAAILALRNSAWTVSDLLKERRARRRGER